MTLHLFAATVCGFEPRNTIVNAGGSKLCKFAIFERFRIFLGSYVSYHWNAYVLSFPTILNLLHFFKFRAKRYHCRCGQVKFTKVQYFIENRFRGHVEKA